MYADGLLSEMLSDHDIAFALQATGTKPGPRLAATVASIRQDPLILAALVDDHRIYATLVNDPQNLVRVTPYFLFSVILRQARWELRRRTFTAEWVSPRRRVPVFDAKQVAEVLDDESRLHYLAELLASFSAPRLRGAVHAENAGRRRQRFDETNLAHLRTLRASATAADCFALDRRLGDVALFLAGVFPDNAHGAVELAGWEAESQARYRQAARAPLARQCGLHDVLDRLASELHPSRKALNFAADRFLFPLRADWFQVGA